MPYLDFIGNNTLLIGLVVVIGFVIWKFVMQPIMNEGKPIEPDPNEKTFEEEMKDNLDPNCKI